MNDSFKALLTKSADKFLAELESSDSVRVFAHHDADGLCSAALMIEFLRFKNKKFHLTILPQIESRNIKQLEGKGLLVLCDFGSGQLNELKDVIKSRKVLILDHHQFDQANNDDNLIHVNPYLSGVNGNSGVSASGVAYLFIKHTGFSPNAVIALIGASGDYQDVNGFKDLNQEIINECCGVIERKDLRIYGANTRPIHKALEYSSIIIPGVSSSGSGSINFLQELGIELMKDGEWRTISDLTSSEKQKLISAIIIKRNGVDKPEDIFTTVYEAVNENGFRRNLREFSSLLNACGRLGRASIGISVLMNKDYDELALEVNKEYKELITQSLNWFENNKSKCLETDRVFYLRAGDGIKPAVIGTICSILSNSGVINKDLIIGMALDNGLIKVSARKARDNDFNIGLALKKAIYGIGEGGGHNDAGGAYINKESVELFINNIEKILKE